MEETPEGGAVAEAEEDIESQLSPWNGSQDRVVAYVKSGLHDPSSFEHLETSWLQGGDFPRTYLIIMDFTSRNIYGGRQRSVIRYEVIVATGEIAQVFSIE